MTSIPSIRFASGNQISVIGYGLFKVKPETVYSSIKSAIEIGYRHFDGAMAYGNEKDIGDSFTKIFDEGLVKREDIFVTSKLWNTFHSADKVEEGLRKSLDAMNLSFFDLYMMHWPMGYQEGGEIFPKDASGKLLFTEVDYLDTWRAMEECQRKGLVREIGVCNFNRSQLERLLAHASIKPSVLQVESHPYLNNEALFAFARSQGLICEAFSPFASPDRWWAQPDDPRPLEDPVVMQIAAAHSKTSAQVILRWQYQRRLVTLVKAITPAHMKQNLEIFEFSLTAEDMTSLNSLDRGFRVIHVTWAKDNIHWPFRE